jgi:hypothetical protein
MFRRILRRSVPGLMAGTENRPEHRRRQHAQLVDVRALATEAALAVSLDASPAVVVSMYEHAQRGCGRGRRTA